MMPFDDETEDGFLDEADYEADQSAAPDFPTPRASVKMVGHDEIERQLLSLVNAGKVPHAMMFAGRKGIGKAMMAYRFAKFLLTRKAAEDSGPSLFGDPEPSPSAKTLATSPDDAAIKLILSGGHPDLLSIELLMDADKGRAKESISVEQIREVNPFLHLTPFMGGWRVVIIDEADTMTRSSQNALLKILEEPPADAILILITHRPGHMLPTIRSRCRVFDFRPLGKDDFYELLGSASGNQDALYAMAEGSVGQALVMIESETITTIDKIGELLSGWPRLNWAGIHAQAEYYGGKGNDGAIYNGFENALLWICTRMSLALATGQGAAGLPPPLAGNQAFLKLLGDYSLQDWSEITGKLQGHFDMVRYGTLDKRHGVLGAFSILEEKQKS